MNFFFFRRKRIENRKQTKSIFFFLYSIFSKIVENNGVEPLTSCVQGRRSSQLS